MSTADVLKVLVRERAENRVDEAELWRAYRAVMPAAVALFARNTLEDVARGNALRDQCRALDAKITALARPSLAAEELQRQREKLLLEAQAIEGRFPHDVLRPDEAAVLAQGRQDGGPFKRLLAWIFGDAQAHVDAAALAELLERLEIPAARHRAHVAAWIAAGRAKVKMETRAGLKAELDRIEAARRAAWGRAQAAGAEVNALAQELHRVERDWINAETAQGELGRIEQDYPEIFPAADAGSK